jgi:light-regulated signal transduction histidine kinase (bacteriophytochrome)/HAMP domain-containing protein
VDQETGVRGYALTRADTFLTPYRNGIAQEQRLTSEMRRLTNDKAARSLLSSVQAEMAAWRTQFADPTIAAVASTNTADTLPILSNTAKAQFDQIRASVTALQDRTTAVRSAVADQIRRSQNLVVTLLIVAAAVVVLAGLALTLLLRRLVTTPVVDLAGEVRRVARGEYDLEISSAGPPELVRLAGDVNAMRQQIVADLGTVRRARLAMEDANRRLEQQAEELTRSNRDLEQFAYVASHDLQEPLRKVASFCQLLQRRYANQLDERADQYIAFAVDGAQRMQRLINDLLAFSRIGRITNGFTEVDLESVVTEAASQLGWRPDRLDGRISWSGLPTVYGEEPLLAALFTNLISNSLKFRHPDRQPRVHLEAERVGDEWQISCADNGIGIEPAYADKIFVIFQRLHPKNEYPGTGIGLAITKKIIEYHGGRIWLDTQAREGTLIRFTLPVAAAGSPATEPATDTGPARDAQPASAAEPTTDAVPAGESGRSNNTEPASSTTPELIGAGADTARAEETAS